MKRLILSLIAVSLLSLLLFGVQQINFQWKKSQVHTGVEELISQLPTLETIDTLDVTYQEFSQSEYGLTCHYGRAYVILGTQQPLSEVLEAYLEKLYVQGWHPEGHQYANTKILIRYDNDRLVISLTEPTIVIQDQTNYAKLKRVYKGTIFIIQYLRQLG